MEYEIKTMKIPQSLSYLLAPWLVLNDSSLAQLAVHRLQLDSRKVTSGDTFVAINGHAMDGRQFIADAVARGANLVLAQADPNHGHAKVDYCDQIPVVYLAGLDTYLSALAGRLYAGHQNQVIAVTGTNGKTTISQLIAQWLELLGERAAVMGTTGNGFLAQLAEAANTTGNAIDIQAMLHQFAEQGARYTAMEVSSHGLVQGRVKAVPFIAGVFSNLSRDHLDYHGDMQAYAEAKQSLFTEHDCQQAIINVDDPIGAQWARAQWPHLVGVSLLTPPDTPQRVWAKTIQYAEQGIQIDFDGSWGAGQLQVPLIGEFNACNVLLALSTLLSLGFAKSALLASAHRLKPVIGRMELFSAEHRPKIVVDYAHTPDALEKALLALRVHCTGKLWVIFGCGGDRDTGKRPMMAAIAERCADQIIFTDDNPRSESASAIIAEMQAGLKYANAYVEHDRFKALQHAFEHADEQDIILLAGKGHEDYQVLADQTVHYSDRESAQQLLGLTV